MRIAISRVHYPVTSLGPGLRVGIWTQGCTVGCAGCVSLDTWEATPEHEMDVAHVVRTIDEMVGDRPVDGITITGGEPSDQAPAVTELISELRRWAASAGRVPDVLLYSGRTQRWLEAAFPTLVSSADALIPEPFLAGRPVRRWRGSSNQPIVAITDLGRDRYPAGATEVLALDPMQVAVEDGTVWLIGIPRRGDLEELVARTAARGVQMLEPSWRA